MSFILCYDHVEAGEIFVSEGAEYDISRLKEMWGPTVTSLSLGFSELSDLKKTARADIVYFCDPKIPTNVETYTKLKELVDFCIDNGSILVFDANYTPSTPRNLDIPKSIYEIKGARDCAIEVNSFSKYSGFTGVSLGWTIIPNTLKFSDGSLVSEDYKKMMTTTFIGAYNIDIVKEGASKIVLKGSMACT